ncbi:MAG: glycerol-3-phosphate 1-O-acyltransferase PlsY [Meiothermus sp.]|uniref:glycerol-3-phosphate 1-O-acyltransferase PlsY n=1 Tax=Meiothermus sp. TaxID=1955249 RepID=UPI0025D73965|nr:glycerol-3-phosphate 1-O-acyltransferase PlsY [Meiothermus sp.]MCS7068469.1 glycerol-3-phosphate 1-O-acyltransferase PlsY [Meiothermus sp.]MDW8425086.1 glycerol-3-phosphate 1-O-acyltransferase PlsY [Meiothermus sp.]
MEWTTWLILLLAYLFGAIPAGAWVARYYGVDIQKVGSGNTGATNILRTLGAGPAALVAAFDVFKGGIAVLLARLFGIEGLLLGGVALAAVLGHNYSVFLRFTGGKGVATSFGTLLFLDPLVALLAFPVGVLTMWLTRFVSAGSMIGGLTAVLMTLALGRPWWEILTVLVLAALIFWTHRENIKRLQAGNERRLGEKSPAPEEAGRTSVTP